MFAAVFPAQMGASLRINAARRLRRVNVSPLIRCGLSMQAVPAENSFDFFVIGGGSGGVSCARRAAQWGARVAVVERARMGGTCVNVGCVPKKVMYNAATLNELMHEANEFGFSGVDPKLDWAELKRRRDKYVLRLNGIYERNLDNSDVTVIEGDAKLEGNGKVRVGDQVYSAPNILIAVGGKPAELDIPGKELLSTSDDFFDLEEQPGKVAVIGAGYIAVEMAGIFNGLGSDTSLFVRGSRPLRKFEEFIVDRLMAEMERTGLKLKTGLGDDPLVALEKDDKGKITMKFQSGKSEGGYDFILSAVGRVPVTDTLQLDKAGVEMDKKGYIVVDEFQNTAAKGVYALGDAAGKIELTPMAIAAGRRLSDRLFGGVEGSKADYESVPTVIFSHPPIGTIGLTEKEAREAYGDDNVRVYTSNFVNLYYGTYDIAPNDKPKSTLKLVCVGEEERVVGLHCIGMGSDELLQGFGVAMKMGATKKDLDACVAIHPTAAEELVTLPPWGLKKVPEPKVTQKA
eukprot:scaffold2038_cov259-Pinguiococcus_pyrenoidosus.AAC.2